MRPLVLNYPDDPRVWALGHEFLWGDDLLVAPVTREGATAWPVYLPAGRWHDFWTGAAHEGPGASRSRRRSTACRSSCARGAIMPMGPVVQHTGERPLDEVTLLIYPEGRSRFELYEDDGRSNAYRQGRHAVTAIECADEPGRVMVRIDAPAGDRSVDPGGPALPPAAPHLPAARGERGRPRRTRRSAPGPSRRSRAGGSTARGSPSSASPPSPPPW